jgi:chromosome segregation ATPase
MKTITSDPTTEEIEALRAQVADLKAENERLNAKAIDHEVKHDVAVATLEKVKEDRRDLQKALACQCAETKLIRDECDELKRQRDKRVAEACAKLVKTDVTHADEMADLIRSGEWRKYL